MKPPGNHEIISRGILHWAAQKWPDKLIMTSAFGFSGVALIHLVYEVMKLKIPVIFIDTGYHYLETIETARRVKEKYNIDLRMYKSDECLNINPRSENCCDYRKVIPMKQVINTLKPGAIISARGRFQAVTRQRLTLVEWQQSPIRINPMVHWTQKQIQDFVEENSIPYNELYDQGYPSVGCWPCTRPIKEGEDIRAGRWDGLGRIECGLWK